MISSRTGRATVWMGAKSYASAVCHVGNVQASKHDSVIL